MPIALTQLGWDLLAAGLDDKYGDKLRTMSSDKGKLTYSFKRWSQTYGLEQKFDEFACELFGLDGHAISLPHTDFAPPNLKISEQEMMSVVIALNSNPRLKNVARFELDREKGIPRLECLSFPGILAFGASSRETGGLVGGFREACQDIARAELGRPINIERAHAPLVIPPTR